jgi:glycine betaine monooxygenase B
MILLASLPRVVDELDGPLVCTAVEQVTHDVRTFHLATPESRALLFEPGQYVTVTAEVEGAAVSRCYSITSPATAGSGLSITVKRVPGGPVSNWLHENLVPGGQVQVTGPFGSFGSARVPGRPELHLTAGSGLTPLMCMARSLVECRDSASVGADVVLVHHARTPADIIFRDELERLHDLHPGIRVVVVCEEPCGQRWRGHRGRISHELLEEAVPDLPARDILVCGPPRYMQAARGIVLDLGADPARVHEESYDFGAHADRSPASVSPSAAAGADGAPDASGGSGAAHTVEFRRSGRTVSCTETTAILVAASEAGITHPSSCRSGMCGTCKTTMLSGSVEMNHAGGIRPREVADHKILLCCSTPTSDVVVDA